MTQIDLSRRAFFRQPSVLKKQYTSSHGAGIESRLPQRPPWALTESLFNDQCTRCNACITACEEEIIIKGDGGFPEINFQRGECTFCEACLTVCEPNALLKQPNLKAFYFTINIDDACLAKQKTHCQSCKDVCDSQAISMPWPIGNDLALGAIQAPEISIGDCTSCGACISTCPSQSIHIIASPSANGIDGDVTILSGEEYENS